MKRLTAAMTLALLLSGLGSPVSASESHLASWYGYALQGSLQANGVPFDAEAYVVANKELPLGTVVEVCYESCVIATVTDRGPYVGDRSFDLSYAVARDTGLLPYGVDYVGVTVH